MNDPIHRPSSSAVSWTTGNVAEAIPGVLTPLAYTFWTVPFERTVRGSYADMGVLSRREGDKATSDPDQLALGIFYGRAVLNVNLILTVGAGLPGTNSEEVAASVLGDTGAENVVLPPNRPSRYPVVAVRLPLLAARLKRRMLTYDDLVFRTWTEATALTDPAAARAMLPLLRERFTWALVNHSHATFLSTACFEPLAGLVGDRTELLSDLLSGYGGMIEVAMLHQLWEVAHDQRDLQTWLSQYGYLGAYAGNLRSQSWREDPAPLHRLRSTYRGVGADGAPGSIEVKRVAARRAAERTLLSTVPRRRRPGIRLLLGLAGHFVPLREIGKNMYLRAGDAARAAIRLIGAELAARGTIANPADIWFLTWDELVGKPPVDLPGVIEQRKAQHRRYEGFKIPDLFTGTPEPILNTEPQPAAAAPRATVLTGIAACAGVAEGRARVVGDPTVDIDALEPGEVLVAAATDPSWTTLFPGAAAVVIDLGGVLSHGAIVARELGIPCVTNVRTGTAIIRSGELLRVDGTAGTVTRLDG